MYKIFICDVDGCLNDGKIHWDSKGKLFKSFGNYDHDGLKLLKNHMSIKFITADQQGWDITYHRITTHMGFELELVKEKDRFSYVAGHNFEHLVYMGDGIYDAAILRAAALGIAPLQARKEALASADFVTPHCSGEGAVTDGCLYILEKMDIKYEF